MSGDAWRVVFTPAAERELRRLPADAAMLLGGPIFDVAAEPQPPGSRKVSGTDLWRIRVRDIRVIYALRADTRTALIVRVVRRAERTYRRLR